MLFPSEQDYVSSPHPQPLVLRVSPYARRPLDLYRRLVRSDRPSFLLESGSAGVCHPASARYSIMGGDPYLVLIGKGNSMEVSSRAGRTHHAADPWLALQQIMDASRITRPPSVPPFFGGAVGLLSYDLASRFDDVAMQGVDDLGLPDLALLFVDQVAVLDHHAGTLDLIFTPSPERFRTEPREKLYREGRDRLHEWLARATAPSAFHPLPTWPPPVVTPGQSRAEYTQRVRACQAYIASGDIYQANLSHRFTLTWPSQPASAADMARACYAQLTARNPSPFSGLVEFGSFSIVSTSPERLVRLSGRRVDTRPIAGTRGRGQSDAEDQRLARDLLANPKERAEHVMLVDLARNDLGKVSHYGTVHVDEWMAIERYSHVSHIVSNVSAELREGCNAFDLLEATFPGGTITGVPKVRCRQIIDELEPVRRGFYTGGLGYLCWSGDLDFNILIRTLILTKGRGYLQVGAGIVADSEPDAEYQETLLKAQGVMTALASSCGSS